MRVMNDAEELVDDSINDSFGFNLNSTLTIILNEFQKLCDITGFSCSFSFLDFQRKFLLILIVCLLLNIICLHVAWRIYGERICEMFMKPAVTSGFENSENNTADVMTVGPQHLKKD